MLEIYQEKCLRCGGCIALCPTEALLLLEDKLTCDEELCLLCGDCVIFCPVEALELACEYQV